MKIFFKLDTQVTVVTLDDEGNNISKLDEIKTYLAGEPISAYPVFEEDDRHVTLILDDERTIMGVSRNLFQIVA